MSSGVTERASIPSLSECDPGLVPSEFNVLILPETVEEKTKGGIILVAETKDSKEASGQRGRLISMSPVAFDYAKFTEDQKPKAGDVVLFAKFAGVLVKGLDGRDYRVCKDRDIMAVEVLSGGRIAAVKEPSHPSTLAPSAITRFVGGARLYRNSAEKVDHVSYGIEPSPMTPLEEAQAKADKEAEIMT